MEAGGVAHEGDSIETQAVTTPSRTIAQRKSVAVLPFSNVGGDKSVEYFSDGMTEELITALAKVQGLRVAARTSSFSFKDRNADAREIGAKLGVATILEGSVRQSGNRLRVSTQLVDCGDAYVILPQYTGTNPRDSWSKARQAGARALALDATLAEAHASLAYGTMLNEWDWTLAEAGFKRAIAADPDYPTSHHWYADFLAGQGRIQESLQEMQRAHELDPLSLIIATELGWVHYLMHRPDDALAQFRDNLALDQNYSHTHLIAGFAYLLKRDYKSSIASLNKALELGGFLALGFGALIHAHALSGDRTRALELLSELRSRAEREYVPPFTFAVAYTGLGDKIAAFEALNRGVDERDVLLAENFFDPVFDSLRTDERYVRLLRRMGIAVAVGGST